MGPSPAEAYSATASVWRRPCERDGSLRVEALTADLHGRSLEFGPVSPPDRPLSLGELLSETVRIYGQRPWSAIGVGLATGGAYLLAALTPDLIDVLVIALAFTASYGAAARLVGG